MNKIMLTCRQSTFFSSVKNTRKLGILESIQHRMHLMVCKACKRFDIHANQIDQSFHDYLFNEELVSEDHLSSEKKSRLKDTVNQSIKK
ncbi:MAG: hypothetical protein HQ541_05415 [Mariniphaga sp.]|nr:hypothetical protein [Mariniphaga sp.]